MDQIVQPARDRAGMVRTATRFFNRNLSFSTQECAKMLGLNVEAANDLGYLEKKLIDERQGVLVEERCVLLMDIKDVLEERFKEDFSEMRRLLREAHRAFKGMSPRTMIVSGRFDDLKTAKNMIRASAS